MKNLTIFKLTKFDLNKGGGGFAVITTVYQRLKVYRYGRCTCLNFFDIIRHTSIIILIFMLDRRGKTDFITIETNFGKYY